MLVRTTLSILPIIFIEAHYAHNRIKGIITPNDEPPPPIPTAAPITNPPTSPPPPSSPPFATAPPPSPPEDLTRGPLSPISNSIAVSKCEEYTGTGNIIKRSTTDIVVYVFGGTPTLQKEFPHMAALGFGPPFKVQWLCGGSLISDQFVLTAAHCVASSNMGEVTLVRLGATNIAASDYEDYGVIQRIIHPDYRLPVQYNDIALLKLDRQVLFSDSISPICLQPIKALDDLNFIATGWGKTEPGGPQTPDLMKVDLYYYPNSICNQNYILTSREYLPYGILDDSQICAGSSVEDRDTCQGDSGGPLQTRDQNGHFLLVGITSFGKGCGVANSPGVYTRVSNYVSWIESIVWQ